MTTYVRHTTDKLSLFIRIATFSLAGLSAANAGEKYDYPTQARVEYVLQCMDRMGGQSYNTLYPCICAVDKIAEQINYQDFSDGQLYTYLRSTGGEAGALFREGEQAEGKRDGFLEAEKKAFEACLIKSSED